MRFYIVTVHVACLLVLGCLVKVNTKTSGQTISAVAKELGANLFAKYVADAGVDETLSEPGPFTVFVPTDAAFDALPNDVVHKLSNDKDALKALLLYHIVSGEITSGNLKNDQTATTLHWNMKVRINVYGGTVTVDGSKIVSMNHKAGNGVIHLIDKVLYPLPQQNIVQFAASNAEFSTLTDAIIRSNLIPYLSGGPFTFFAPTDKAFNNLPVDILESLQDETKATDRNMVNDANIIIADVPVSNGVVHVIDTVLIPPA